MLTSVSVVAGRTTVTFPIAPVGDLSVIEPAEELLRTRDPMLVPATPSVSTEVPSVVNPAVTLLSLPPAPSMSELEVSDPPVFVTVPDPPLGIAQLPSPRQNVEDDAAVPLFRFPTGRFPVTPVVNGSPVQLVSVPEVGVPRLGVTNTGDANNTAFRFVRVIELVVPEATHGTMSEAERELTIGSAEIFTDINQFSVKRSFPFSSEIFTDDSV